MAVDNGSLYASQEVFLQHFLCFLRVAYICHILLVHSVEVASFYPCSLHPYPLHLFGDGLVGVDHKAFRIGDS